MEGIHVLAMVSGKGENFSLSVTSVGWRLYKLRLGTQMELKYLTRYP